ncbi:MAG: hypothetical protein HYX97_05735 [Chloroflexi bacterium]|nr:hypothetical protein [Chloroflexota bacterium]
MVFRRVGLLSVPLASLLIMLIAAACGGGSSPAKRTPPEQTVTSRDGRANLAIPTGALPDGVDVRSVRITELAGDAVPLQASAGAPLAAYRLEPDGLVFRSPITLKVTVPISGAEVSLPLLLIIGRNGVEMLQDVTATLDPGAGTLSVEGKIAHFTDIAVVQGLFTASVGDPGDRRVGETFRIGANVAEIKHVLVLEGSGIRHEIRLVDPPWRFAGAFGAYTGRALSDVVTPNDVRDRPPSTQVLNFAYTAQQSFTCVRPGGFYLAYVAYFNFTYEVSSPSLPRPTQLNGRGTLHAWSNDGLCRAALTPTPAPQDRVPTPTPSPTATPPTTTNRPPEVRPIQAFFDPPRQSTLYQVFATDPEADALSYVWSGPDCGNSAPVPGEPWRFRWAHPHPPCDPTTEHANVTIRLEVRDETWSVSCEYRGAHDGTGPRCAAPVRRRN